MKKIIVTKPFVRKEEKVPIKTRLTWYDAFYKKMLILEGTKLSFEYQEEEFVNIYKYINGVLKLIKRVSLDDATEEQKRIFGIQKKYIMRPKVEIHYKRKTTNKKSDDAVQDLFKEYQNRNNTNIEINHIDNSSVVFSVPNGETSDFIYELNKNRMEYDIK